MSVPIDEQYRLAELIRWHLEQPPQNPRQWWIDETIALMRGEAERVWRQDHWETRTKGASTDLKRGPTSGPAPDHAYSVGDGSSHSPGAGGAA